MKAIERLYEYLALKSIKPTAFEKEIGLSNGYLGTQKKRNADMGEAIIIKIIDYCQDLSLIWLITGEGKMLKSTTEECTVKKEVLYKSDPRDTEVLIANKETIEVQKELISALKQHIKELERVLSSSKSDVFPTAQSAASTGGTHQSKITK